MTYVVLGIGACLIVIALLLRDRYQRRRLRDSAEALLAEEGFEFVGESESKLRVSRILPSVASEDVSALLVPPVSPSPPSQEDSKCDFLPDAATEWSIRISLLSPATAAEISEAFPNEWRRDYPGVVYGRSVDETRWTFVDATDTPASYQELIYAVDLVPTWKDPVTPRSESALRHFLAAVKSAASTLGASSVEAEAPALAVKRGTGLFDLWKKYGREAIVTLKAPDGETYDGRDIWDVMLALGLEWGDGDLFHWRNESEKGDSVFFSVWTTTDPGYFVPEEIAADRCAANDLVFGYSIPRSAHPLAVFDQMMIAARYARKRLGGSLLDHQGRELDEVPMREEIAHVAESLSSAGLEPGCDAAMRLF